jgi:hypothetical protein
VLLRSLGSGGRCLFQIHRRALEYRHKHGERSDLVVYWSWHAHRFKNTIGATLACTITYEGLLEELNHKVGAL